MCYMYNRRCEGTVEKDEKSVLHTKCDRITHSFKIVIVFDFSFAFSAYKVSSAQQRIKVNSEFQWGDCLSGCLFFRFRQYWHSVEEHVYRSIERYWLSRRFDDRITLCYTHYMRCVFYCFGGFWMLCVAAWETVFNLWCVSGNFLYHIRHYMSWLYFFSWISKKIMILFRFSVINCKNLTNTQILVIHPKKQKF